MRKILMGFTLILLIVGLSGCFFIDEEASCNIVVSDDVNQTGTLYKTVCTNSDIYYGLINEDLEPVISEVYEQIDDGFTLDLAERGPIEFAEDIKYFRTFISKDDGYKQQVIDRNGQVLMDVEASYDVMISENQETIYSFYNTGQIYHIEANTYEAIDYRIIESLNGYHIAELGDDQVVVDANFHIIHEGNYERVLYVSSEQLIYKKADSIYSKTLLTNEEIQLFDTLDYPSYIVHDNWPEYVLINPNSYRNIFFINSQTGEHVDIEECSRLVTHYQDTFTMRCDIGYKVLAKDSLEVLLKVPRSDTYILPTHPVFFSHTDEQTTLHSTGEVLTFDKAFVTHRVVQDALLELTTEEKNIYIDLETFNVLYETDKPCMYLSNQYRTNFLFHQGECTITYSNDSLEVISIEESILSDHMLLEFQYYTEDLLFFVKDGQTVITDYDLNVLYD